MKGRRLPWGSSQKLCNSGALFSGAPEADLGGLKSTTVGAFTPWKLANATDQGLFFKELVGKHLPAGGCL